MKKEKINILGTDYTILNDVEETDDTRIKNNLGFTDISVKEIYIAKLYEDKDGITDLEKILNKVKRHEIIHAFLYESGINGSSNKSGSWAENEEMVDWFAIQSPKIYEIYKKLNIL